MKIEMSTQEIIEACAAWAEKKTGSKIDGTVPVKILGKQKQWEEYIYIQDLSISIEVKS